jgi:hypothetical protein
MIKNPCPFSFLFKIVLIAMMQICYHFQTFVSSIVVVQNIHYSGRKHLPTFSLTKVALLVKIPRKILIRANKSNKWMKFNHVSNQSWMGVKLLLLGFLFYYFLFVLSNVVGKVKGMLVSFMLMKTFLAY